MRLAKTFAMSLIGASAGLLLYCGSFYIRSWIENRQVENAYEMLRDECLDDKFGDLLEMQPVEKGQTEVSEVNKNTERRAHTEEADNSERKNVKRPKNVKKLETVKESFGISWENLADINEDIVAWITIPGADISYPVVQGEEDEYYLYHSIKKEKDPFGSIFLGSVNHKEMLDSHSFIYGHNMEGNMMFANLNRYENPDFLRICPEFEIITPLRKFCYEIFSVEQAYAGGACFEYGYETGSNQYRQQLQALKANSMYDTGIDPDETQTMVTLITCNSRLDKDIRMAVHGICRSVTEA